jgi:hypothetical protein
MRKIVSVNEWTVVSAAATEHDRPFALGSQEHDVDDDAWLAQPVLVSVVVPGLVVAHGFQLTGAIVQTVLGDDLVELKICNETCRVLKWQLVFF